MYFLKTEGLSVDWLLKQDLPALRQWHSLPGPELQEVKKLFTSKSEITGFTIDINLISDEYLNELSRHELSRLRISGDKFSGDEQVLQARLSTLARHLLYKSPTTLFTAQEKNKSENVRKLVI